MSMIINIISKEDKDMLEMTKKIILSGTIKTGTGTDSKQVMYCNSSLSEDGGISITKTIKDSSVYYADKENYDVEVAAFDAKFDELVRTAYVEKEETAKADDTKQEAEQTTEEIKEDK